jgi:hypothetical protein
MPRTLFIVEDKVFTDLPQSIRTAALDEAKRIFKFIPNFQVVTSQQGQFPPALDFTDSVFRVGKDGDDLAAFMNVTSNQQWKNILASIKQKGINVKASSLSIHTPSTPERFGVGFMWKEVIPVGNAKLAITETGGLASLEDVQQEVVKFLAHDREKNDIQQSMKDGKRKDEKKMYASHYHGGRQEAEDLADLKQYDLLNQSLKNWPVDVQKKVGVALGRVLAHEVRHQYVDDPVHAKSGLGADSPAIMDDKNYGDFDDQPDILNKLRDLERKQQNATVQIETIPKGEPFPF